MGQEVGIGALISLIFWFIRYRVADMPKHVADAGIVAGLFLVVANLMEPTMKPGIWPSAVFLISALGMGYAFHLWRSQTPILQSAEAQTVVGHEVVGNSQGGAAEEIISSGQPGQPSVGAETTIVVPPGQSAIGTRAIQNGPGTGMRIIQNGPGVGYRSTVIVQPPPSDK